MVNLSPAQQELRKQQAAEFEQASSQYADKWRFREEPELNGRLLAHREWTDKESGEAIQILEVERKDGERRSAWASPRKLAWLVGKEDPQAGDAVVIVYLGEVPLANGHKEHDFLLAVVSASAQEGQDGGDDDLPY